MPNDSTRRNIAESAEWADGVYQLEENDVAEGGPDGILNQPHKDLAARTNYLKKLLEQLQATVPGTAEYESIMDQLKKLDVTALSHKVDHSERLIGNLYLAIEMANIDPDGYDGMVVETFDNGAKEIDQAVANVTSVVSGDDSIDVESSSGLIIGARYQLTDGEHLEEVQIKSINVSGKINRVILESAVQKQYNEGRAKLYRSSAAIYNGRAYGGGNVKTDELTDCAAAFSGSNTKVELTKSIDYSDPSSFTLKGAHLKDGKLVMGGAGYGIVLTATGSTYGTWKQINGSGDDLAQDDLPTSAEE